MALDKHKHKHPETDPFGIVATFNDAAGATHTTSEETRAALKGAMGADPHAGAPDDDGARGVRVLVPGGHRHLPGRAELVLEDGASSRASCPATCRTATTGFSPRGATAATRR